MNEAKIYAKLAELDHRLKVLERGPGRSDVPQLRVIRSQVTGAVQYQCHGCGRTDPRGPCPVPDCPVYAWGGS